MQGLVGSEAITMVYEQVGLSTTNWHSAGSLIAVGILRTHKTDRNEHSSQLMNIFVNPQIFKRTADKKRELTCYNS